jgi:hypothetical protein
VVLGKKGVFFTISAILFLVALSYFFKLENTSVIIDTTTSTVVSTNAYRERLETVYFPLLLKQYSFSTLVALSNDAYTRPTYLVLPNDFQTAIVNGTYRAYTLSNFTTLSHVLNNLSNESTAIGYNLSIYIENITVYQSGAFQAYYVANISFNLSSRDGSVRFKRNIVAQDSFSLNGVPDLFYNRNTPVAGDYRSVNVYRPRSWNNSVVALFVQNRSYVPSNDSPSIFGRLQGINAPNPYGVETFLPSTFSPGQNYTSIDWQYMPSPTDYTCVYLTPIGLGGIQLNLASLIDYNITGANLVNSSPSYCPPAPS